MQIVKITAAMLIATVAGGAALAGEESHGRAAKGGGSHKSGQRDDDDDKPWMHTIPINQRSRYGLPLGMLNYAVLSDNPAKVIQLLSRAPHRPGDEAERKMWQACVLALQKRFEQADEAFMQLKNWHEFPCSVKNLMARSYAEDQKYNEAIEILTQVLATEPSPDAYIERAGCYASGNKLLEAAHDYERASRMTKFSERTYLVRGASLLVKIGRTQEALGYVERAEKSRRDTPSPALHMVKADCYIKMGERQKAIDCLILAEEAASKGKSRFGSDTDVMLPTILVSRAKLYRELGKIDLAKKDRQKLDSMTNTLIDDIGAKSDLKKFRK